MFDEMKGKIKEITSKQIGKLEGQFGNITGELKHILEDHGVVIALVLALVLMLTHCKKR